MEVVGKVRQIGQTEQIKDTFKKRQIVIDTDEQYSQAIAVDFVQDKTSLLDNYKAGQSVKVSVNLRGSEYNGKFYVNLNGWRIEKDDAAGTVHEAKPFKTTANVSDEELNDLPF